MFGVKTALKKGYSEAQLRAEYAALRLAGSKKSASADSRQILFIMGEESLCFDDGRNAYMVLSFFAEASYQVFLLPRQKINWKTYRAMGYCARRALGLKNVSVLNRLPDSTGEMLCAVDSFDMNTDILARPWKQWIYLNFLKSPEVGLGASRNTCASSDFQSMENPAGTLARPSVYDNDRLCRYF